MEYYKTSWVHISQGALYSSFSKILVLYKLFTKTFSSNKRVLLSLQISGFFILEKHKLAAYVTFCCCFSFPRWMLLCLWKMNCYRGILKIWVPLSGPYFGFQGLLLDFLNIWCILSSFFCILVPPPDFLSNEFLFCDQLYRPFHLLDSLPLRTQHGFHLLHDRKYHGWKFM